MYQSLYVEINVISLLLLLIVFYKTARRSSRSKIVKKFQRTVLSAMVLPTAEIIWILGETKLIPLSVHGSAIVNTIFMCFTGILPYFWLVFSEEKLGCWEKTNKLIKLLALFPVVLLSVLCILSIRTGWVFHIDEANIYHRGPLYLVQLVISYLYMLAAFLHAIYCGLKEENFTKRGEAFILASFLIAPAIGGVIQAFFYGVPSSVIAISISLLMVFINFQETRISRDSLTGLNNRRRADEYLHTSLHNAAKNKRMVYYIMDVDSFKSINDTYGHTEGDRALGFVADALRATCNEHNIFVARIGGDEFCIMMEVPEQFEPEQLIQILQEKLDEITETQELPYQLSLSVGFTEYTGEGLTAKAIVDNADKMLYQAKKLHHHTKR